MSGAIIICFFLVLVMVLSQCCPWRMPFILQDSRMWTNITIPGKGRTCDPPTPFFPPDRTTPKWAPVVRTETNSAARADCSEKASNRRAMASNRAPLTNDQCSEFGTWWQRTPPGSSSHLRLYPLREDARRILRRRIMIETFDLRHF